MPKLILLFALFMYSTSILAEGEPWREVWDLRFSDDKIGFVVEEADAENGEPYPRMYFEIKDSSNELTPVLVEKYIKDFKLDESFKKIPKLGRRKNPVLDSQINVSSSGCVAQEEGSPVCKTLIIKYKEFSLSITNPLICRWGCDVYQANVFKDHIWLSLGKVGEYGWYGYGVYVFDLKTEKLLFSFSEKGDGSGLDDLLVNSFKLRNEDGFIYASTNNGIKIFEAEPVKLIRSIYMPKDYNPKTGRIELKTSSSLERDNSFIERAKEINLDKDRKFLELFVALPEPARKSVISNNIDSSTCTPIAGVNELKQFLLMPMNSHDLKIKYTAMKYLPLFPDKETAAFVYNEIKPIQFDQKVEDDSSYARERDALTLLYIFFKKCKLFSESQEIELTRKFDQVKSRGVKWMLEAEAERKLKVK